MYFEEIFITMRQAINITMSIEALNDCRIEVNDAAFADHSYISIIRYN